ncbi:MAG: NAD-dependent malic enzyme [candidate division SR1 bacterium CG_4_9_14_3_um_filter_40_9]|nr:MAG: NAD-dependent malic enzyme [candidate division SR1 bacterium CG_4_9_14_3_um_filter_40_9]
MVAVDYYALSLEKHTQYKGKLEVHSKVPLNDRNDLSTYYTPGVAEPCRQIQKDPELAYTYTWKNNAIAVISDGSAVLGLGNIGGIAGLPVMEGKAILFKEFGGVDAIPIVLATQDADEIIKTIENIAPTFGGINLEDISAPRCFYIEEELKKRLNIPVFHDDQHGTAIVVLAGLINALKLAEKEVDKVKIVISGAGSAGIAIGKLLIKYGIKNIVMLDSVGAIHTGRTDLNKYKADIAQYNINNESGTLAEVIVNADVFIGVSQPNVLNAHDVRTMNQKPIIFAMANPNPEITPIEAQAGGVFIMATGRSDYPNQINNLLAFPGIFRGALDKRIPQITDEHKLAAAIALANYVQNPSVDNIIPSVLDKNVGNIVATAVMAV